MRAPSFSFPPISVPLGGGGGRVGTREPPRRHGADRTLLDRSSAAVNNQTNEGVAIKKVTNVFSKKILAKRALREIKLLQHFRGHRNVR